MGDGDGSWDFGDKSWKMGVWGIRVGRWEFVGPCFLLRSDFPINI